MRSVTATSWAQKQPFFYRLVPDVAQAMGEAYPELVGARERVAQVLRQEEERFADTLENGMAVLEGALRSEDRMLDGDTVFRLYDTYGFPLDLTADIARERGVTVDFAGFEAAMGQQRERARAASKFGAQNAVEYSGRKTEFHGYDTLTLEGRIVAIYKEGVAVSAIEAGDSAVIVLDKTPFYAEAGGQVGDRGQLVASRGTFHVRDTQKIQAEVFGHHGVLHTGTFAVGDMIEAKVDSAARARAAYNHSATHLMHAALRKVLGPHVQQKGSLVDPDRTRFDYSHSEPLTAAQIREIENLVNREIRRNAPVEASIMKYDDAIRTGAMALFGEKYGDEVRVLKMGDFSTELCGGTHVRRTGDIGFFKVVSETGIAAGVRRVEAVTADGALAWVQEMEGERHFIEGFYQASGDALKEKLKSEREEKKAVEKELARLRSKLASSQGDDLAVQAVDIKGARVVAAAIDGADAKALREAVDKLKAKLKSAAIVLGSADGGKVVLIAGVTSDLTSRIKAGDLANFVAQQVGGKGGGRPDMAQAGGNDPAKLPAALASVSAWVGERL